MDFLGDTDSLSDGKEVVVAGLLSAVETKISKKNARVWATATVEDLTGSIEVNFFPATYSKVSMMLVPDTVVVLKARVSLRDGAVQLNARELSVPSTAVDSDLPLDITVAERMCVPPLMKKLAELLRQYPGGTPVRLHIRQAERTTVVELGKEFFVAPSPYLFSDLKVLLGRNCVMGR